MINRYRLTVFNRTGSVVTDQDTYTDYLRLTEHADAWCVHRNTGQVLVRVTDTGEVLRNDVTYRRRQIDARKRLA
jgi:hypothetical protein